MIEIEFDEHKAARHRLSDDHQAITLYTQAYARFRRHYAAHLKNEIAPMPSKILANRSENWMKLAASEAYDIGHYELGMTYEEALDYTMRQYFPDPKQETR